MNNKESSPPYYPIFLDIREKKCVVVGGGEVALRKVKALVEHGARVEVVSPDLCAELDRMAEDGEVHVLRRDYAEGDLAGAVLVVAATNDGDLNAKVAEEAKTAGALINAVDDPEHCDFIVPSYLRRGDITIAISTGGRSPALARKIRTELERQLTTEYASLTTVVGEVRSELRRRGVVVSADDWRRALDLDRLTGILQSHGSEEAKVALMEDLMQTNDGPVLNGLHLCVVGVNHSTMPIEFREKLAVTASQLGNALILLSNYVAQGIVLSTCNRTEVYVADSDCDAARRGATAFLRQCTNMPRGELLSRVYTYEDSEAMEHLFRVASGLDSMILGEFEILGQVRQALEQAEKSGSVGLPLLNLFRQAVQVGRMVRDKTGISRNALSVSSVAVDLAGKAVGDLGGCRILVIGAGEAGKLVAKAAREKGAYQMAVTSRSHEKASVLADALGGEAVSLMNLNEELMAADIIISCTGAPHVILDSSLMQKTMQARGGKPLVVIDIAVPRDVEADVGEIDNIFLYNIDDLNEVSNSNRKLREKETKRAMAIIKAEVNRFDSWWQTLGVRDTIGALVRKAEDIRQAQLAMTLKKLRGLPQEDRDSLEAMTKSMMQKLLHEPIEYLKRDQSSVEVVSQLFRLHQELSQ